MIMAANGATASHSLKSVLAKPVVVMIETVWKTEWRTAASPSWIPASQSTAASTAEATSMQRDVEAELLVARERAPASCATSAR